MHYQCIACGFIESPASQVVRCARCGGINDLHVWVDAEPETVEVFAPIEKLLVEHYQAQGQGSRLKLVD